ncbi:hypothetical protein BH11PSE8_BH11PSE8_37560 [soil metagenome]
MNRPPADPKSTRERVRSLLTLSAIVIGVGWATQAVQGWHSDRIGDQVAAVARPGDIYMISSNVCEYCTKARNWFTANSVPFGECFIETDAVCAARFADAAAPGTPVIMVRGEKLVGFDARAVADVLGARSQ